MATPVSKLAPLTFKKGKISNEKLRSLYEQLTYPRLIEEKMLILLRQGKVSKWFSGIGQEAISVGCAAALYQDELIFTMHRNLGVFTTRQVPLDRLFEQWQGKSGGFTKGRDRSFHFGSQQHGIVGMISHLGPQLSLAAGVALAHKLRKSGKVSLAFTGDGATSQGEFHEALNTASVWKLPVIFVIENNGYGLSTPNEEQFACESLALRGAGYGMKSISIDGNNILEVYSTIKKIAEDIRENPEPYLVECRTFRMRGHEEASGTKYVPSELSQAWHARDPIENFERYLLENNIIKLEETEKTKAFYKKYINESADAAFAQPAMESDVETELNDVFQPFDAEEIAPNETEIVPMRFIDAISDGLREAMQKHENLVLMGQDIADYGGVFKITDGFVASFGKERVRNTPLCESAIVGIGLGLSLAGMKAMVEMQFADFVSCGFNQIVNNLAKLHYRWGEKADVVIRMPTGGGTGAGPFHSQSNEAWFTHVAGLKVVYPSNPRDAKGLLIAALRDPNPVLFFEHKALYRSLSGDVPKGYYTTPIGKAALARTHETPEMSIITYGAGVHWATEACEEMNINADILDLRSLVPLDYEAIETTVKRSHRVIILHEDNMFGGLGGEISAWIGEHLFEQLDAPVMRVASLDMPIPFSTNIEKFYLPTERLKIAIEKLKKY